MPRAPCAATKFSSREGARGREGSRAFRPVDYHDCLTNMTWELTEHVYYY